MEGRGCFGSSFFFRGLRMLFCFGRFKILVSEEGSNFFLLFFVVGWLGVELGFRKVGFFFVLFKRSEFIRVFGFYLEFYVLILVIVE